ncbi:hypothetical protein B296_00057243 [Ensete ventricosum]|uniref:Reverse transcriptase domain-containing protein n=1 Tax=Ensete ventricosum TaxID=4639 RepID=A0A426X1F3_ENSVE|nr:hypothetical protein B296_00057243 [Ensete ventricosum]
MANAYFKRVMIDTGSSPDILYFDVFQRLGLTDLDLAPLTSILTGFTGDSVSPLGATMIPVTFGGEPRSKTLLVSFMVVQAPISVQRHHQAPDPQPAQGDRFHVPSDHQVPDPDRGRRADAHLRALAYRRVVTKLYNRRVRPQHVETGDLVLRKTEVIDPTRSRGKLAPNWEGPYRVIDAI